MRVDRQPAGALGRTEGFGDVDDRRHVDTAGERHWPRLMTPAIPAWLSGKAWAPSPRVHTFAPVAAGGSSPA